MSQDQRVLIAEGDANLRQRLHKALLRGDVYSDWAVDGREALDRLEERSYAMVLLDAALPIVDSHAVIERVRAIPSARRPMILVTSVPGSKHSFDSDLVQIVLHKPLDVHQVSDVIASCLRALADATRRPRGNATARLEEHDTRP